MRCIRPFIGSDLIKIMTGIQRYGKSAMLKIIKQELMDSGISPSQFISFNFGNMSVAHLRTAQALHKNITQRAVELAATFICSSMKFRK